MTKAKNTTPAISAQTIAPAPGASLVTEKLALAFKRVHPAAIAPKYATDGSGCFDLFTLTDGAIDPLGSTVVDLGLSFEVPQGYTMLVMSRSGHGFNFGIRLANGVGVIDSDYRGAVKVALASDNAHQVFRFAAGDRIAQAMLVPTPLVHLIEVDELSQTERGAGGFGSTGA
jgi:dUTP pyrophosphatase